MRVNIQDGPKQITSLITHQRETYLLN